MKCPYCHSSQVYVTNSRPTKNESQVWRRKHCQNCKETFTTYERIDLSHLVIVKKSDKNEKFSHAKLFSGIYGASIGYKGNDREKMVDRITSEIERQILFLKKKELTSEEIADITLKKLKEKQIGTFMRFLAYCKDISTEKQLRHQLRKYLSKQN